MSVDEKKEQDVAVEEKKEEKTEETKAVSEKKTSSAGQRGADSKRQGGARRTVKNFRKSSRFGSRPKPEFEQKIINISRVTRVVKGGRRLSFRVDMIIGDGNGRVGLGTGKARDTSLAIQKAYAKARKNILYLKLTEGKSLPYEVRSKVTSSAVEIMPNKGRGLVAGSTVRNVLQIAGITDVTAKLRTRSKNKLNNAKAAIEALSAFKMSKKEEEEFKQKLLKKKESRSFQGRGMRRRTTSSRGRNVSRRNTRGTTPAQK